MNASQEKRLLLAALDFAAADKLCRESRRDPEGPINRLQALKKRRLAKQRLLRASGEKRTQRELDVREALR
jgi:hypothetical protein